jgi:PEP-CTERM motif
VFTVEDGVTANAGDYLVNNRFIDPNAPTVPEPSSFPLMIFGMGLLVAGITRRRKEAFR